MRVNSISKYSGTPLSKYFFPPCRYMSYSEKKRVLQHLRNHLKFFIAVEKPWKVFSNKCWTLGNFLLDYIKAKRFCLMILNMKRFCLMVLGHKKILVFCRTFQCLTQKKGCPKVWKRKDFIYSTYCEAFFQIWFRIYLIEPFSHHFSFRDTCKELLSFWLTIGK